MRLHQKAKEVNPAIIRKYLRMRSLVQWLQAAPHLKVAALREDARVVVRHRCHRRETVAFKRIIGVVRLKVMMWAYSQRWRPSARAS